MSSDAFHPRAPATGNAQLPSEDQCMEGITTLVLEAEAETGETLVRLNLGHELEILREIFRAQTIQTAIYQDVQFEVDAFWHRQPVKLLECYWRVGE